jgi:hypothetical protein
MKADQNTVEAVPIAQRYQSISKRLRIPPEFNWRNVQVQEHVTDAHLAHYRDPIRNPQAHRGLHPLVRVHTSSEEDENNIGKTLQS